MCLWFCSTMQASEMHKMTLYAKDIHEFFSSLLGWWSDEAIAALLVWDVDPGPDPPAHAQPLAGRDDAAKRAKVRAALPGPPRRALHARLLPGDHHQAHRAQVRQRRLRLSQVYLVAESGYEKMLKFFCEILILIHPFLCLFQTCEVLIIAAMYKNATSKFTRFSWIIASTATPTSRSVQMKTEIFIFCYNRFFVYLECD